MSGNTVTFDCGCKFPLDENNNICLPSSMSEYLEYLSCPRTMDLFASGFTQGVFQLESELGKTWAKKLKPENEEHISALVALLRPGVLLAVDEEGKNMAQHYVDRKNGLEPITAYHESLSEILEPTYQILLYQESCLRIAQHIAGFNLHQADSLRKAIGKKLTDVMAKVEKEFIDGVKTTGLVSEEVGKQIFGWIKESQSYSFNKCITLDTVVNTPNGDVELSNLNIGDFVNSPYGYIEVLDILNTNEQEVYEVELESGKTIQCTLKHEFLCEDDKKHTLEYIIDKKIGILTEISV